MQQPKDNVIAYVSRVVLGQGTSKESGSVYNYLELEFKNGWKPRRIFLNSDAEFALKDALTYPTEETL